MKVAVDIETFVYDEMDKRISSGIDPREAAAQVLELIKNKGLSAEWTDFLGSQPVLEFWRHTSNQKRDTLIGTGRSPRSVVSKPREGETIFDTKWPVGEGWIRLGDMTVDDLKIQSSYYRKIERSYRVRADAFDAAMHGMKDGLTVQDSWKEDDLKKVFTKALAGQ